MSDHADGYMTERLDRLLENPELREWFPRVSRPLVARCAADCLRALPTRVAPDEAGTAPKITSEDGGSGAEEELIESIVDACALLERRKILPVLNATGTLLREDLGRSPIAEGAWDDSRAANVGYSTAEFDLATGERGERGGLLATLAAELAGSEAAIVLNNGAAALLLALSALTAGREVVVSRGELVEGDDGCRVSDLIALSGARLVEAGTTNVTRAADYAAVTTTATAAFLVARRENFVMRGRTNSPSVAELAAILPDGALLVVDQGSDRVGTGLENARRRESSVACLIGAGASLVCFSCDGLIGGPQAGIAAGRADLVARLASHPLASALKPGKTVMKLLEESLVRSLNGEAGKASLPDETELEAFGKRVARKLPSGILKLLASTCASGGGSSPDEFFPSRALEVDEAAAEAVGGCAALLARLREATPPIVAAECGGKVRLDLAALRAEDPSLLAAAIAEALGIEERPRGAGRHPRARDFALARGALPEREETNLGSRSEAAADDDSERESEGLLAKALRFEKDRAEDQAAPNETK